MMPDLGDYAANVIGAYAVSLVILVGIIALSVWQARAARRALAEEDQGRDG